MEYQRDKVRTILMNLDFGEKLTGLDDENAGKVFMHMLNYANGNVVKIEDDMMNYIFLDAKKMIDDDHLAWEKKKSRNRERKATSLYIMYDGHTHLYKIGRSVNPKSREETLQAQVPLLEMLWHTEGFNDEETYLHELFKDKRVRGEWFKLSIDDVEHIQSLDWRT